MSSGPMIRQSALALVIATVAQAYASSSWTICSSSGRARKYFLRPPVRKPTLVWARMTVWAVMPAQVVTPLETMESWDSETKLLDGTDWSYRYDCAGLGISMENTAFSQPVYNRSKSSTACVSARGTSQKIGRKPPRCGISWVTNLPKFQLVPLNVTNSGFWYVTCETRALLDNTRPHFWRPATCAASAKEVASMLGSPSLSPRKPIHKMAKAARWISREKHGGESPMRSCQVCATAGSMALEPCSRSCRIFEGNEASGQSRYRMAIPPRSCAWVYWVWQRRANGRLVSFFRNDFDSLLFFSPPGVCLWSPDHTSKQVAGVLATEAASSMFPYCCPSSSRKTSTLLIQSATGLNCWLHSCWKPPPHPMRSDFCRMTWFRLEGSMSSGV